MLFQESTTDGYCPDECQCKWKGGKETVECTNSTFTRIPVLDHTTQVLDLSFNNLMRINENVFQERNLYNLQKIYMRNCRIHIVIGRCFKGITNLVELDLSFNLLQTIPKLALEDCKYLMTLSLRGNPITRVPQDAFKTLIELKTLDLSQCQLAKIDSGSFQLLTNLHWLRLDNNRLENLQPETDFPSGLNEISLHNNKWRCDCELLSLQKFLMNSSFSFSATPLCSHPDRISGQEIRDLAKRELACTPKVSPTTTYQEIILGKNMTLVCLVNSIPKPEIDWRYKGLLINNGSTMVSDIDMRPYYYTNTDLGEGRVRSELVLLRTNLDDNGTFQCIAENRAGIAAANFTLNVVIPVPPKPPQDVVEDRFQKEYIIAIGIAGVVFSVLITIIIILLAVKCRGIQRRHKTCWEEGKTHLYDGSMTGSDISSDVSLRTLPHTTGSGTLLLSVSEDRVFPHNSELSGREMIRDNKTLVTTGPDIIPHINGEKMNWRRKQ